MKISVIGTGLTKFGELWEKSLVDLALGAARQALNEAQTDIKKIDAIFVANMMAGQAEQQVHLGALIGEHLGFTGPTTRIEAACASGGMAVRSAVLSLLSGEYRQVLVIGCEKMTDYQNTQISKALMSAACQEERLAGLTLPALFALMARAYLTKYKISEKEMAAVAVKNHFHASFQPLAQFPFKITTKQVLSSPQVAEPIKLLDCSPISDGAAAVVLASQEDTVKIVASAQETDQLSLCLRQDLTRLKSVARAAQKAYRMAKIGPDDVDLVEAHDCFTIAEIMALEELGFYPPGKGWLGAVKKETYFKGKLPVNLSGGLKAFGHPAGATGVKQIVVLTQRLRKQKGIALAENIGGAGATAVIHILKN